MLSAFVTANEGPVGAKAVISEKNIVAGDIVELKIRAIGQRAVFPDIKEIDGVKVLTQIERVTNMHTYSHGVLKRERTSLFVTFSPQKDMTIPSYEVEIDGKLYKTEPIELKMKDTQNGNNIQVFSLKLKSTKKSVRVGEAFLVTVSLSLLHGVSISKKLQYSRPKFKGFFVETVDKGKSYNQENHQITELKYILTPHTEGNFTLGPAHAKIALQDKSERNIFNLGFERKWFQKATNTLALEVRPQTVKSDLVGTFRVHSKVNTQKVEAHDPVKLTVKLEGRGDLSHFDFSSYELDGVSIYSDKAKITIKMLDGEIYSNYSKIFVFISKENFTIPERIFTVVDPKTGTLKYLKINAFPIVVKRSQTTPGSTTSFSPVESKNIVQWEEVKVLFEKWWILILSFILGALSFYLLRYLPKREQRSFNESEALKILYGHISKDQEVEEMVRKLYARKNGDRSVKIDKKRLKELVAYYKTLSI